MIRYPFSYNPILDYWEKIESGEEIVSEKIYKTIQHLVWKIQNPGEFFYSIKRANHILEFAENLCHHSKGKSGGQLVKLELWEKAHLAAVFGFIDIEGNRQYRESLLIVGKKNGKSLLASIVGNYMLVGDNEPGPEVYAVAPLSLDTEIMTTLGMKTMGEISIGDYVFTPEGKPTVVEYISPIVETDSYRISFDDGSCVVSTGNHPWAVEQLSSNGKNNPLAWKQKEVTTGKIVIEYGQRKATRIKCAEPPIMPEKTLPIKPYTLGAWLGDGRNNRGCICGHINDIELRQAIQEDGYTISYMRQQNNTVYFTVLGLRTELRKNNLLNNKHIPEEYFFSSTFQRMELLRGLMDTDGTCTKTGECRYVGNCEPLCRNVFRLALSLGYKAHLHVTKDQNGKTIYIVSFKAYQEGGKIFKLNRKSVRQRMTTNTKSTYRYVVSVELIATVPCRCIGVADKSHLFCVGQELIATHNTKKDQSKIIWGESKRMVRKSPHLLKRVKPLVSELYSDYNDGTFKALASDSDTLDGLNVHCCLMDEIHQWKNGKALYDIMADGTTAREEPLIFITSTAGKIREDIYDEKYAEAEQVINGYSDPEGYHDDRFIAFIYELDNRKEWTDPACWKKANPGLGTIKSLGQLEAKVKKAQANPMLVRNLVCKEFNIRETASEAWLNFEQLNNTATFDVAELKPRYGIGGVDLSITTDLTAACVLFMVPGDNTMYYLHMYWLPEELLESREKDDKIPYSLWRDLGLLRTTPGNKVDYRFVVEWFKEIRDKHDIYIPYCGYDNYSANYFVQDMKLEFGESAMEGVIQGAKTLSGPLRSLGADLDAKRINYNNNPITKWCLSNVSVMEDRNANLLPCKTSNQRRRIDGFAAMLDAYVVLERHQEEYINMI